MFIKSTSEPIVLEDYDFTFANGFMMTITINPADGDTVTINERVAEFLITPKPSTTDPNVTHPAEHVTIFMGHVLSMQHHSRMTHSMDPELREEWNRTLKELAGPKH